MSIISLIAVTNKRNKHSDSREYFDLLEHADTIFQLSTTLSGKEASKDREHVSKRLLQAWGSNRINTLYGDKNEYKYFSYFRQGKGYIKVPAEYDDQCWRKLIKKPPSINSTGILFDINSIGLKWSDVYIRYISNGFMPDCTHHINEWEMFLLDLNIDETESIPLHQELILQNNNEIENSIKEMVLGSIDNFLQEINEYDIVVKNEIEEWVQVSGTGNIGLQHKFLKIIEDKCSGWLYNKHTGRDFIISGLPAKIREIAKTSPVIGLALIDIDDLTQINKKYGSIIGDSILQIIPLLTYIIFDTNYCGRCGDDTFFALLTDHKQYELHERAKKFLNAVRTFDWERLALGLHVTCSIGLGPLKTNEKAINAVKRADIGMNLSKKRGKNRIKEGPPTLPKVKEKEVYKGSWS